MIRNAKMSDVPVILDLINFYAKQGLMLPKNPFDIYRTITAFVVYEQDGKVVGTGKLSTIWKDLAEIASLAVLPEYERRGIGRSIVTALKDKAAELDIKRLFTLTYQQEFFEKCGFTLTDRESLPHKVFGDCLRCPKVECCDETALIYDI